MATVARVPAPPETAPPQGAARSSQHTRMTSLRGACPEPTKAATVAQVAAAPPNNGVAMSGLDARMMSLCWASQAPTKMATFAQVELRGLVLDARMAPLC